MSGGRFVFCELLLIGLIVGGDYWMSCAQSMPLFHPLRIGVTSKCSAHSDCVVYCGQMSPVCSRKHCKCLVFWTFFSFISHNVCMFFYKNEIWLFCAIFINFNLENYVENPTRAGNADNVAAINCMLPVTFGHCGRFGISMLALIVNGISGSCLLDDTDWVKISLT